MLLGCVWVCWSELGWVVVCEVLTASWCRCGVGICLVLVIDLYLWFWFVDLVSWVCDVCFIYLYVLGVYLVPCDCGCMLWVFVVCLSRFWLVFLWCFVFVTGGLFLFVVFDVCVVLFVLVVWLGGCRWWFVCLLRIVYCIGDSDCLFCLFMLACLLAGFVCVIGCFAGLLVIWWFAFRLCCVGYCLYIWLVLLVWH